MTGRIQPKPAETHVSDARALCVGGAFWYFYFGFCGEAD